MSCTFCFLCQPRNNRTLMQVKHFAVQELFSCELQYSFLTLRQLQLQAIRNFVSKLSFQNFRTDSSFKFQPTESRNSHPVPGLLINSAGNEVAFLHKWPRVRATSLEPSRSIHLLHCFLTLHFFLSDK